MIQTNVNVNSLSFGQTQRILSDKFCSFLGSYIHYSDSMLQNIGEAFDGGDLDQVNRSAHQLKPTSEQLGFDRINSLYLKLQDANNLEEAREIYGEIEAEYKLVREFITSYIDNSV